MDGRSTLPVTLRGRYLLGESLGRTLADVIDDGPMDPVAVRRLGIQVLDGLAAAHGAGLMHRDIKPANVLVAGPEDWKIADFGIAKSVEAADPGLTATGLIIGTPAYLAPERLAGGPATSGGDLYAVGVVLYEALVGRRSGMQAVPLGLSAERFPSLGRLRPGLPPDLVAVVTRAIAPDPAARFRSAPEMAVALGAPARPARIAFTVATESAGVAATHVLSGPIAPTSLARQVSRSLRRRRTMLPVLAAAILVVGVALAIAFGGHQSTAGSTSPRAQTVPEQPSSPATTSLPGPISAPSTSITPTTSVVREAESTPASQADNGTRGKHKRGGD